MKQTAADKAINNLIDNGWTVSHTALVTVYVYAGAIRPMKSRGGREYCRVHMGKSVNVKMHGGWWSMQRTTVLYRDIKKAGD